MLVKAVAAVLRSVTDVINLNDYFDFIRDDYACFHTGEIDERRETTILTFNSPPLHTKFGTPIL